MFFMIYRPIPTIKKIKMALGKVGESCNDNEG